MAGGWFYAHGGEKRGPFSGDQLKEFAASGMITPTDIVWKAGVEDGVEARLVKNLFKTPPAVATLPAPAVPVLVGTGNEGTIPFADEANTSVAPDQEKSKPRPAHAKRGSAIAITGADIVSQDGVQARYRMKCSQCGHADSGCRTITISTRTTKTAFFCPKCKKRRDVVIQCRLV